METKNHANELQAILEAIKSSDVVENRIELLTKLGELDISDDSDLVSLAESLTTLWEDFTCLDVSQCMLNKAILHVAIKYPGSNTSGSLKQFLALGTKASIWCVKHLKMTFMSTDDSEEEEHSAFFYQLLLDFLGFSGNTLSALAKYSIYEDKVSRMIVENFVIEQLNLTKESLSERTHSFSSEVQKAAQIILSAVIKICKVYSESVNLDLHHTRIEKDKSSMECQENDKVDHTISITTCTIERLCEMGTLAANDGGNLVTILNISWKGVVTLLQLCKGALTVKVNVANIILNLITLANDSLKCAAQAWSFALKENVTVTEARKAFLPVKFYLINAARISSQFPCQSILIYRDIILFVLKIFTFKLSLGRELITKVATEVLTELLEKTSMDLMNSLLNSDQITQDLKFEILDWTFTNESSSIPVTTTSMEAIFLANREAMCGSKILLLGRVFLFLDFLKSCELQDVQLKITQKFGWFLDILIDEEVYSSILALQIPVLYGSGQTAELVWQPMFSYILHTLKIFMIIISSTPNWSPFQSFLIENVFHPQLLCMEIVTELLCFMVRHMDKDLVTEIIDKLCGLFRAVACPESVFLPRSALRKMARLICILLLADGTQSLVDRVYRSVNTKDGGKYSSVMNLALLMEGFPLNLLSDNLKTHARESIVSGYFSFIESFDENSKKQYGTSVSVVPIFALSAALQSHQVSVSDIDGKTLKFLASIILNYRNSSQSSARNFYRKLLSETLSIISDIKILQKCASMEQSILDLQDLFVSSEIADSDPRLYECKPNLALFMESLGHMELIEDDTNVKSVAVWGLYHVLFSDRHWAFVYLAIKAFEYFAKHTSCNELWRFVPKNATLSHDLVSGKESNEDRFMAELKAFLEKEMALLTLTPSSGQLEMLVKEGLVLKEKVQKIVKIETEPMECEITENVNENKTSKKRKFSDEISKGVELLQSGTKVIGDVLLEWQENEFVELHDKVMSHFTCLEDLVRDLVSLTGNGEEVRAIASKFI